HLKENPDVPIWELFVEPLFSSTHIRHDTPPREWGELFSVAEALRRRSRVVVLGDPGSGKSTLVNWLTWIFSQTGRTSLTEQFGSLVPLPFILRELPIDKEITWDRLVEAFLNRPVAEPLRQNHELFEEILCRGQALFLLDGLDEVGDLKIRERLRDLIWEGITRHDDCKWVMTSRIVDYEQMPFDHPNIPIEKDLAVLRQFAPQGGTNSLLQSYATSPILFRRASKLYV